MPLSNSYTGLIVPQDFGAVGDGTTDDSTAMQAFFDASETAPEGTLVDWAGEWGVSETVTIKGARTHRAGLLKVVAGADIQGPVAILDASGATFLDQLRVEAYQAASGTLYSSRLAEVGLEVLNGENTRFCSGIKVEGLRRDGVRFAAGAVAHRLDLGEVFPVSCGSASYAGNTSIEISILFGPGLGPVGGPGRTDLGNQGDVAQRCLLDCQPHADLRVDDFVIFDDGTLDEPYQVVAVNADSIEVYPWLPAGVTSGTLRSAHGAGVRHTGSNSSNITVRANPIRCGTGLVAGALYGMSAQVVGHACAIGVQLGRVGSDRSIGNSFDRAYFEGGDVKWQVVQAGRNADHDSFRGAAALDLTKIFVVSPRLATGGYHYAWDRPLFAIERGHEALRIGPSADLGGILASNAPSDSHKVVTRANPVINLAWLPEYAQWRHRTVTLDVRGPTGGAPGNITLQPAAGSAGDTIQGAASFVLDTTGPVFLRLIYDEASSNWLVAEWPGVASTPAP